MKRNFTFIIILALIFVVVVGYYAFQGKRDKRIDYTNEFNQYFKERAEQKQKEAEKPNPAREAFKKKQLEVISATTEAQSKQITFFGKVVDQHGQVAPNVTVFYSATSPMASSTGRGQAKTNQQGIFEVKDARGAVLYINEFNAPAYDIKDYHLTFYAYKASMNALKWTDHVTPETAYMFDAWKIEGGYPKVKSDYRASGLMFEPDGRVYTWDLLADGNERFNSGEQEGDMSVSFAKDDANWKVVFTAHDGGFIETEDRYLNLAPESGYQPSISYEGSVDEYQVEKTLYFTSRNHEVYGWINIRIRPEYRDKSAIHLKYVVNVENERSLVVKKD